MRRIVPARGTRLYEELRYLVRIEVSLNRGVRRRAERPHDRQDLVLLDEAPRLLEGPGWGIAVIKREEGDAPAVNPALLVNHAEIGAFTLADNAGRGKRPAIRHGLADLDLAVAGAGAVVPLGADRRRERANTKQEDRWHNNE